MATVIGIFEDSYKTKNIYQSLNLEPNLEDSRILVILLKFAMKHGGKTYVDITVFLINKATQFLR